jgi:inhibitor of cysteine peptidase
MKRTICFLLALMLVSAALVACSSASADKIYGENDKNISAGVGETFTIQLDENPTTGYGWVAAISDESVVKQVSTDYQPTPTDTAIVGSGGQRAITFKGLKADTATLTLTYERSWEKNNPAKTLVYNVTVK